MSEVGFVTMGKASGGAEVKPIGVGMLGYAFMGKAHSNAYKTLAYMTWPPPLRPELVLIAGRNEEAVAEAARRYGFSEYQTDWRAVVTDPRVELFDNSGPNNLHAEPTILAAESGKHVICEKPLGRDAAESYETWQRVQAAGVKHMCAFNYRFVPAVRLARELIEAGEIGESHHFRASYLQDWGTTTEEATRFATGRKNALRWEINGSKGSIAFDLERLNELQVNLVDTAPGPAAQGFRSVLVTEAGSGIGEAVARGLHAEGAEVVLADAAGDRAAAVAADLGDGATPLTLDVRDEAAVAAAMDGFDVLTNVAGIGSTTSAPDTTLEVWEDVFAVNARGTFLCCKHAIPGMVDRGGGAIVNMASVAGLVGLRNRAAYCASKGAVVSFTRAMAIDHVADGIRVNCVCPGTVDTPWVRRLVASGESLEALAARQPMGRLGT